MTPRYPAHPPPASGLLRPLVISCGIHGAALFTLALIPYHGSGLDAAMPAFQRGDASSTSALRVHLVSRPQRHEVLEEADVSDLLVVTPSRSQRRALLVETGDHLVAPHARVPVREAGGERGHPPIDDFFPEEVDLEVVESRNALDRVMRPNLEAAISDLPQMVIAPRLPVTPDSGNIDATIPAAAGSPGRSSAGGVSRGAEAAELPAPIYPTLSVRRGEEGIVLLRVVVGADGGVLTVDVLSDPGFPLLRDAAVDAVRKASFRPAVRNGRPVRSTIEVPIRFDLRSIE